MTEAIISKAALARELELSKARVSQLIISGLPVRDDGKICRTDALAWLSANTAAGNLLERVKALLHPQPEFIDAVANIAGVAADVGELAVSLSSFVQGTIGDMAIVALQRGVEPAMVWDMLPEFGVILLASAIALVDETLAAPPGYESWGGHPWFRLEPVSEDDWAELVAIAGKDHPQ